MIFTFINLFANFVSSFLYAKLKEIFEFLDHKIDRAHASLTQLDVRGEFISSCIKYAVPLIFHFFTRSRFYMVIFSFIIGLISLSSSVFIGFYSVKFNTLYLLYPMWILNRIGNGFVSVSKDIILAIEKDHASSFIFFRILKTIGNYLIFINISICSLFLYKRIMLTNIIRVDNTILWIFPLSSSIIILLLGAIIVFKNKNNWHNNVSQIVLLEEKQDTFRKNLFYQLSQFKTIAKFLPFLFLTEMCHITDQIVYLYSSNVLSSEIIGAIKTCGQMIGASLAFYLANINKKYEMFLCAVPLIFYNLSFLILIITPNLFKCSLFTFLWGMNLSLAPSIFTFLIFNAINIKNNIGIKISSLQFTIGACYAISNILYTYLTSICNNSQKVHMIYFLYTLIAQVINMYFIYKQKVNK